MTRDELFNKCDEQDNRPQPAIIITGVTPAAPRALPPAPEKPDGK
ncbi:MAG TPA: hypothetical protein VEF76_09205 [Patescibacteria group bacterium]|nr:hypothetical protein [Patescibacteria group bacterium]